MFSALKQGSTLYILEKENTPVLKVGQVVSITAPQYNYMMSTVDINVRYNGDILEFKNVPATQNVATYNNAIITETKELMLNEVENLVLNSRQVLDSVEHHRGIIESCEEMLKDLNPRFAKEKERDEDISNLKTKLGGIESKMDDILSLLTNKK